MGVCNSTNEKPNKPNVVQIKVKKNKKDSSSSQTKTSISTKDKLSDYIIPSNLSIRSPLSQKYKLSNEFLGRGASGIVSEGTDQSGQKYAIKTINKLSLKSIEVLVKEVEISLSLNHPHIIKYYEVYEDLKSVSVVMDLAEGGDLFDFILKSPDGRLSDEVTLELMIQILETMDYLHNEKKICHRDIKPENFLIIIEDSKPNIKLIDFGFATYLKEGVAMNDYLGTPQYTAPEIINREPYDEKVDLWSIGILLFNMLTGCQPFTSESYVPIEEQVCSKIIPFEAIENRHLKNLCYNLLERDPSQRYNAKRALNYAYEIRDIFQKEKAKNEFDKLAKDKDGKVAYDEIISHYNIEGKISTFDYVDFNQFYNCVSNGTFKVNF